MLVELGVDGELDVDESGEQVLDEAVELQLSALHLLGRAVDLHLIFRVRYVNVYLDSTNTF